MTTPSFRTLTRLALATFAAVWMPGSVVASDVGTLDEATAERVFDQKPAYSPYAGRSFPNRPLFGDTHLHTSFSMDAGAFGARLGPEDAYRFAKGEEMRISSGQRARLSRPLDFLVVSDHSDGFGFFQQLLAGAPNIMGNETGRRWHNMIVGGEGEKATFEIIRAFGTGTIPPEIFPVPGKPSYRSAWDETIRAAEEANDPGRFTAFIGYEWTSNTGGMNLHRNVIFRDNADRASRVLPFTTIAPLGSDNPADLWDWMEAYQESTGGQVLAIAHNGNLSNGRMFPIVEAFGKKLDRDYAETRMKWERLYEVTQIKGDGEAHPFLSPNDEFADYETWDKGNLDLTAPKDKAMLESEYARTALINGLALEAKLGANPYKFGMVGSTDAHTALSAVEEENFMGKHAGSEPNKDRAIHPFAASPDKSLVIMGWEETASGYAAVWATENTREAIWDAMARRETYATTGPRMTVRFFGGYDYEADDAKDRLPARVGYSKGVPMGGELAKAADGKTPTFLVGAAKDPIGANLDRIQIIKGWVDGAGKTHERIYDVVVSGDREIAADGRCKTPVGNTVDVANASWTNTIGAGELITVWKDPDFDPALRAVYYARVLQIPTPRWTAYDAKYYGIELPEDAPMTTTERAYTSPIWYTP